MNLLRFFFSRAFLINLLIAVAVIVLVYWIVIRGLHIYTKHGESITVPDLRELTIDQVEDILNNKNLKYKINDSSTYKMDEIPYIVLGQDPKPMSTVKENRTIYLSINSRYPPIVEMPDLISRTLAEVEFLLDNLELKIGELIYKPDVGLNKVLEQQVNGKPIKHGAEIFKGTTVDLILGDGLGDMLVDIPQLYSLTLDEAKFHLQGSFLNLGIVNYDKDVIDSSNAKVYKQIPPFTEASVLRLGETIDIWLKQHLVGKKADTANTEIDL